MYSLYIWIYIIIIIQLGQKDSLSAWRYFNTKMIYHELHACVTLYHFIVGVRAETRAVYSNHRGCHFQT